MDSSFLISAFEAILGSDDSLRKEAQQYLENIKSYQGLIPLLILICNSCERLEVRQLAVIYLKNLHAQGSVCDDDLNILKSALLESLKFSVHEKIRAQFEEIAHKVAADVNGWSCFVPSLDAALKTEDFDTLYSALLFLYQSSRIFEFSISKNIISLKDQVFQFFPQIQALLSKLVNVHSSQPLIVLVLKIYWTATYIEIPPSQSYPIILGEWIKLFVSILELSESETAWMCKKWAIQIIYRIFNRYYLTDHLRDHNKNIGIYFQQTWANLVLQKILPSVVKSEDTPEVVLNYYIKYISQAAKHPLTAEEVSKTVPSLISSAVIPHIKRKRSDDELWTQNPIEFIRKEHDLNKNYSSPKVSALDLLLQICEMGYLRTFLSELSVHLDSEDLVLKEALLLALGSLKHVIVRNKISEIHELLEEKAVPLLNSSIGMLRMRACWVLGKFNNVQLRSSNEIIRKTCQLMVDPDLPVRVEAAVTLPKILMWTGSREIIEKEIQGLLQVYLSIMACIDHEELIEALEQIISKFSAEIVPYALELTQHLKTNFLRLAQENSAMNAVSSLNTIGKIIDVLEDKPDQLFNISQILLPVFEISLSGSDYFEESVSILASLLYNSPPNSLEHLVGLVHKIKGTIVSSNENSNSYAEEYANSAFSALANYIQKYQRYTSENLQVFIEIIHYLLSCDEKLGLKLSIVLLENTKTGLDNFLNSLIDLVGRNLLDGCIDRNKNRRIVEFLSVCLWYDPNFTLQKLESLAIANHYFSFCLNHPEELRSSKVYVFFGLGSLVSICDVYINLIKDAELIKGMIKILQLLINAPIQDDDSDLDESEDEIQALYDSIFEEISESEFLKQQMFSLQQRNLSIHEHIFMLLSPEERSYLDKILNK